MLVKQRLYIEMATGQGWKIQRYPTTQVEITGTIPFIQAKNLSKGDIIAWKGKRES
jgi:hypothetical protein